MKKSKRLDYTLIAEGYAEYAFLPTYLRIVAEDHQIQAVRSSLGFKGQNAGKSKVLKESEPITTVAIQKGNQLIIVGVDLDAPDYEIEQSKHKEECQTVIASLGKTYKKYGDRIIHFVSIQAIEQWLAYQAYRINLTSKFSNHSLESKSQNELKKLLYGSKDNGPYMDRIAEKVASSADYEELANQSRSFAHFHKQVVEFLDQYTK